MSEKDPSGSGSLIPFRRPEAGEEEDLRASMSRHPAGKRGLRSCNHPTHPRGEVSCDVVRESVRAIYAHRICPLCGGSQGIARTVKGEQ